jgi:hypothetical protein
MILPTLTSISWSYTAVPVWEWERVEPPRPLERPAAESGDVADAAETGADGIVTPCEAPTPEPDAAAMRLVFKGYEWKPMPLWECLANPDWDHWVDHGRDDASERARSAERNRNAGAALPPPVVPLAPGADDGAAGTPAAGAGGDDAE